jgi:hypothetical protein
MFLNGCHQVHSASLFTDVFKDIQAYLELVYRLLLAGKERMLLLVEQLP